MDFTSGVPSSIYSSPPTNSGPILLCDSSGTRASADAKFGTHVPANLFTEKASKLSEAQDETIARLAQKVAITIKSYVCMCFCRIQVNPLIAWRASTLGLCRQRFALNYMHRPLVHNSPIRFSVFLLFLLARSQCTNSWNIKQPPCAHCLYEPGLDQKYMACSRCKAAFYCGRCVRSLCSCCVPLAHARNAHYACLRFGRGAVIARYNSLMKVG